MICYCALTLSTVGKFDKHSAKNIEFLRRGCMGLMAYSVLPAIVAPCLMLVYDKHAQTLAVVHYLGMAVAIAVLGILAVKTLSPMIAMFEELAVNAKTGVINQSMMTAKNRMIFTRDQAKSVVVQNVAIAIAFSIPFLTAKAAYQVPVAWASGTPFNIALVFVFSPKSIKIFSTGRSSSSSSAKVASSTTQASSKASKATTKSSAP